MVTNLVNTDLSEELLDSLTREERTEVLDYIQNVPFINNLVSIDRPYAKDLPKDNDGKIIVDISHPHILENMDFFRKPALNYIKHGSFTNLRPNGNPNSPFMKWLRNEVFKCWYGVMRPSDGEWIPGYYYYYLNYSPIERSTDAIEGSNMVMRTTSFPDVYDGDYLFFHYIDQARRGGMYNNFMGGQHASIIAARGKGKAISDSTIVLTTEGYKLWRDIKIGDYLYGDDGCPTRINEIFEQGIIPIYEITFSDNRKAYVSKDHLWTIKCGNNYIIVDTNWLINHKSKNNRLYNNDPIDFSNKEEIYRELSIINDIYKNKCIDSKYLYSSIKTRSYILFNFVYPTKESIIFDDERLAKDLAWIARSLGYTAILSTVGLFKKKFKLKIDFNKNYVTIKSIRYSHDESARCVIVDNKSHLFLMNDFIVTHNSFKCASMSSRNLILGENKDICEKVKTAIVASSTEYLTKDGTINKVLSMINFLSKNTQFPSSRIKSSMQDMNWVMGYKNPKNKDVIEGTQNELLGVAFNNPNKGRGKRSHLMIWEEFGMFPNFLEAWNTSRPNVEDGKFAFGQMISIGTGGTEGSDFSGALEMIYNPAGYNVYGIPNLFDKGSNGSSKSVFFWGEYLNRKGCYDKNGNTDVVKALIEIIKDRLYIKYNSTDINAITQNIAERPITIQEAIMRRDGTLFPVADLTAHLHYIDTHIGTWYNDTLVGELIQDPDGSIKFKPTTDEPIRTFPLKDNKHKGALEIYKLPVSVDNKVQPYRYIGGIDPVDDDSSTTVSLPSIQIMDLFTDEIVAEYTGRPDYANDFYEVCRKLALFYNASLNYENDKKGLFSYFSNNHCTYLLCDTPEILRDVELVKSSLYGNKAHPYDQYVYTPKGLQKWGDIQIGDYLFDTKGGTTKVIDIPFDNTTSIYRITLRDGRQVEASLNHLWDVVDYNNIKKTISTKDMLNKYTRKKGKYKESIYYIPCNNGCDFEYKDINIDPYLLGILLGDGTLGSATRNRIGFTASMSDLEEYKKYINAEFKTVDDRHHFIYINNIKNHLQDLNLFDKRSHTKFIPDLYKYNSYDVRLKLLKGLMDTDGCCELNGTSCYTTVSKQLATDIMFIIRSLGINCNLLTYNNKYGKVYTIRMYSNITIFNLLRKIKRQKNTKTRCFKTGIINIEYIGEKKSKCVTVDSEDSCYLIGDFITTHNSKGVNSGKQVNAYARRLIRDWLLSPKKNITVEQINGVDVEKETTIKKLNTIKSRALVQELINWTPDINCDRVSSLGMLMILRESCMKYLPGEGTTIGKKKSYLGNDPFFNKNYSKHSYSYY